MKGEAGDCKDRPQYSIGLQINAHGPTDGDHMLQDHKNLLRWPIVDQIVDTADQIYTVIIYRVGKSSGLAVNHCL